MRRRQTTDWTMPILGVCGIFALVIGGVVVLAQKPVSKPQPAKQAKVIAPKPSKVVAPREAREAIAPPRKEVNLELVYQYKRELAGVRDEIAGVQSRLDTYRRLNVAQPANTGAVQRGSLLAEGRMMARMAQDKRDNDALASLKESLASLRDREANLELLIEQNSR